MSRSLLVLAALLASAGCATVTGHPTAAATHPAAVASSWDEILAHPVAVEVETVVSACWAVDLGDLLNLRHPQAKQAGLRNEPLPIVLAVGVLRHPSAGDFIVDTGVDATFAAGEPVALRGAVAKFASSIEPVESLAQIIASRELDLRGVYMTHSHIDHVLGLPDVPLATPIYVGPGELDARRIYHGLLRKTYARMLDGRPAILELDLDAGVALDPFPVAIDMIGDGSIWALPCPGHTPGSVAWFVNASSGPVLYVGDTSHTIWGWEHGVEPGKATDDHAGNIEALARLRAFAARYPEIRVQVGHEMQ